MFCDRLLSVVRRPSIVNFCFKRLLFQTRLTDFKINSQEGSLGDPLPKLLNRSAPLNKKAVRAKNEKKTTTFKRLLLQNGRVNFIIITQECS